MLLVQTNHSTEQFCQVCQMFVYAMWLITHILMRKTIV